MIRYHFSYYIDTVICDFEKLNRFNNKLSSKENCQEPYFHKSQ